MTPNPSLDARISKARSRLAANLGELQERMTRAREIVSPSTYLATLSSPWLKVGAGVALGLLLGSRRGRRHRPQLLLTGDVAPATPPPSSGILRTIVAATATSVARMMIERAVAELNAKPR